MNIPHVDIQMEVQDGQSEDRFRWSVTFTWPVGDDPFGDMDFDRFQKWWSPRLGVDVKRGMETSFRKGDGPKVTTWGFEAAATRALDEAHRMAMEMLDLVRRS